MDDGKLDEILSILEEIKNDMGGMAAQKLAPKESDVTEPMMEPEMPAMEEPMEEEGSEMEEENTEDLSSLPRWKQRLKEMSKKKMGM